MPLLLGCAIAALLGAVYQLVVDVNPIFYVNLLAIFGAGVVVARVGDALMRRFECRESPGSRLVVPCMVIALLASSWWVATEQTRVDLVLLLQVPGANGRDALDFETSKSVAASVTTAELVELRFRLGWTFMDLRRSRGPGARVSGWEVGAIWIFEAVGLFLVTQAKGAKRRR